MGGRGRGRGRGAAIPVNIEAFGLGRADILTPIQFQPPRLYPSAQFKPVPLINSDEFEYRLALKQELRDTFRKSPFYVTPPKQVKDIARYSDKYQVAVGDAKPKLTPNWNRLPFELQVKKKRKIGSKVIKPNLKKKRDNLENVDNLFQQLEKDGPVNEEEGAEDNEDDEEDGAKKKKKEGEDDGEEEEVEYDEEDAEEENDYNMAYFDNGEGYGDDDDDDDEGPTY